MSDLIGRINAALDLADMPPWRPEGSMRYRVLRSDGQTVAEAWSRDGRDFIAAAPALLREAAEQLAATDALVAELRAEVPHMERWEHDDCLLCGETWPCAGWAAS